MAKSDHSGISARLRRLPGQLLLALINATAMLVIVAAILAVVALARIEHFAENIVGTMTDAVLSRVDLPSKDVLANVRELTGEVRALRSALREIKTGETPVPGIAQLNEKLIALSDSVDRLGSARAILTDEVAARFGDTITRTLMKLRDCSSTVRPNDTSLPSRLKYQARDTSLQFDGRTAAWPLVWLR